MKPKISNQTFRSYPGHYLSQSVLIMIFMALVLFPLGSLESSIFTAIGASTLASSIVTMFAMPNSPVAATHRVIGGYVIGILVGIIIHHIFLALTNGSLSSHHTLTLDICGATAVGITMIIMAMLGLVHPPSAGLALAIVIGPWNRWTIFVVAIAVLVLCLIKYLLRKWFINLL